MLGCEKVASLSGSLLVNKANSFECPYKLLRYEWPIVLIQGAARFREEAIIRRTVKGVGSVKQETAIL